MVEIKAVPTKLDAWAANAGKGARTMHPWPKEGDYIEPALYVPSENVYINGWLEREDTGARLPNRGIDVYIDGVQQTPVPKFTTDRYGNFFGSLGILSEGTHLIGCYAWEWDGWGRSSDDVYVEIRKLKTTIDVWTEDAEGNIKTSFRGIEDVYFNCLLSIVEAEKPFAETGVEIYVDGEAIKVVTTGAGGKCRENLGKLGIDTHEIKGIFWPWGDYERSEDVENPVTVTPFPRILELLPRLDRVVRSTRIWQRYALFRWNKK